MFWDESVELDLAYWGLYCGEALSVAKAYNMDYNMLEKEADTTYISSKNVTHIFNIHVYACLLNAM